jgi:hypothetical protein
VLGYESAEVLALTARLAEAVGKYKAVIEHGTERQE